MDAIRRVYPVMPRQLLDGVFPEYEKACDQLAQRGEDFDKVLWHPEIPPHTGIPEGALKTKLYKWANRFNATEGWFLDEMLKTMRGWYVAPDWQKSLRTNPIGAVITLLPAGEPFCFSFGYWDPQSLPEADYKREALESCEQELSKYVDAVRKRAESSGLIPAPRQYDFYDMDAFVLYQFAGLPLLRVVTSIRPVREESVILKRIRRIAVLLGWSELRKTPRGRPKRMTKPRKFHS